MTLVNGIEWLGRARREHFAVGAFNANTLEQAQAIAAAGQAVRAPVIIQVSHRALLYAGGGDSQAGLRYMAAVGKAAAGAVSTPVVLHLDHAAEGEIWDAADQGFSSVMFECAGMTPEQYALKARELCLRLHDLGLSVEAEVGEVPRMDASGAHEAIELTDPEQAAEFAARTGVDALAISIGSVHAGRRKTQELDFERLEAIARVVEVPLVLHGSSGVTDASLLRGIQVGLAKLNVATQLNLAFTAAVRSRLRENPDEIDPRQYLGAAREAVTERVRERIRLFGSAERA
jgi:fructose-bisphosphate aldolase class II